MLEKKTISIPVYLSAGQELAAATLSTILQQKGIKPLIFVQHRNHSTYLSFGGDPSKLAKKLLGKLNPMEGSASLQCEEINMFGHDGMLGSQVPIAVGACFASKKPTICFLGDAACEEDYVLSSLGWASTQKLPILFVVEDNNLSILTKKEERRNWSIVNIAKAFNMLSFDIQDNPILLDKISDGFCKSPMLINVNSNRMYWHAGAGKDQEVFDRYKQILKENPSFEKMDKKIKEQVEEIWNKELKC